MILMTLSSICNCYLRVHTLSFQYCGSAGPASSQEVSQESMKHWANFVTDIDARSIVDIYSKHKEYISLQEFDRHHTSILKLPNS